MGARALRGPTGASRGRGRAGGRGIPHTGRASGCGLAQQAFPTQGGRWTSVCDLGVVAPFRAGRREGSEAGVGTVHT
eukprot:6331841-Prymnesium_polylepis.1